MTKVDRVHGFEPNIHKYTKCHCLVRLENLAYGKGGLHCQLHPSWPTFQYRHSLGRPWQGWDHPQQGGTRYGCDIWSGGTIYSAMDGPGNRYWGGTIHSVTAPWIPWHTVKSTCSTTSFPGINILLKLCSFFKNSGSLLCANKLGSTIEAWCYSMTVHVGVQLG